MLVFYLRHYVGKTMGCQKTNNLNNHTVIPYDIFTLWYFPITLDPLLLHETKKKLYMFDGGTRGINYFKSISFWIRSFLFFKKIIIKLHTIVLSMCIQPKSFFFSFVFLFCTSGSIPKVFRFINGILHSAARPIKSPKKKKKNHQREIIQLFSITLVLIQGLLKSNVKSVASIMFLKSQLKNKWQTKKDSV